MATKTTLIKVTPGEVILTMAIELSHKTWKLAFSARGRPRVVTVRARELAELWQAIADTKAKLELALDARVVSCYEAGRDDFWLHRELVANGIENLVVDSSSIEVSRRRRRAKTDRIDALKLNALLRRYLAGDGEAFAVVVVPSEAAEDARRLMRELKRLKNERGQHQVRLSFAAGAAGAARHRGAADRGQGLGQAGRGLSRPHRPGGGGAVEGGADP